MRILLAIAAGFIAICMACGKLPPTQPPNVVIILADDMGYGDAGSYGATRIETPNIDRIAQEGLRFSDGHSPHSVCTPTRYGLLTGRYGWRTWAKSRGVWADDPLLIDPNRLTLPRILQEAGYETAHIGKWHLGFGAPGTPGWDVRRGPDYNGDLKPGPLEVGFDFFYGVPHVGPPPHVFIENHRVVGLDPEDPLEFVPDRHSARRSSHLQRLKFAPKHKFTGGKAASYRQEDLAIALTEKAVEWIEARDQEPFFLYFAQRNVHTPLRPNERFSGSEVGVYGDFLHELDWSVGEIIDALDRKGFAKNTLLVFASDNGAVQADYVPAKVVDYNGHKANGMLRGQKTEAYEGGHRVPFLVRWPGTVAPGSESDALVALTDLTATLAEIVGRAIPRDAAEDSFSFLHVLQGTTPAGPVRSSLVHDSNKGLMAIRQGQWKLIFGQGGGGLGWRPAAQDPSRPPGQLFNLADDPSETSNVYAQHPEVIARLTATFERIQSSGRSR